MQVNLYGGTIKEILAYFNEEWMNDGFSFFKPEVSQGYTSITFYPLLVKHFLKVQTDRTIKSLLKAHFYFMCRNVLWFIIYKWVYIQTHTITEVQMID